MRSIVDGTTAAMGVEVCSFYLADHERTRLTLAATNGLDRAQVGKVSLAWGQGITGRVAATRDADRGRGRHRRRALRVGPRLRHRGAWPGCCRCRSSGTTTSSACSTSRPATTRRFERRRDRLPRDDRRAARRDRREGPADGRGRGAAGRADRARCRPGRAPERRDPRAADAAVGRPRLRRPAGRGRGRPTAPRRRRRRPRGATAADRPARRGSTGSWIRSSRRSAARA